MLGKYFVLIVVSTILVATLTGCSGSKPSTTEEKVFKAFMAFSDEKGNDPAFMEKAIKTFNLELGKTGAPIPGKTKMLEAGVKGQGRVIEAYLAKADKSEVPIFKNWKALTADELVARFDSTLVAYIDEKLKDDDAARKEFEKIPKADQEKIRTVMLQIFHAGLQTAKLE
jgi:hypothetical protein